MKKYILVTAIGCVLLFQSCAQTFHIVYKKSAGTISVFRINSKEPVMVQNAVEGIRPYIHPIIAPDGKGVLTEIHPQHHPHQTGLYWGLKRVNERDFFMNGKSDYWKLISASVIQDKGKQVEWQTVYDLIDAQGAPVLTETHTWILKEENGRFLLDLEWKGVAKTDITFGKFYVGGLFLRMPWRKDIPGEVMNSEGQHNNQGEGKRAHWVDVGMQIEGRPDWGHIAILDHPSNKDFPTAWRIDGEFGVGPSRQILGDWKLSKGETEIMRYRLVVYTGNLLDTPVITRIKNEFDKAYK